MRTSLRLLAAVLFAVAAHADTTFYTESWSDTSAWSRTAGFGIVYGGMLMSDPWNSPGDQSQFLYSASVTSQDYSVQSPLSCSGSGWPPKMIHYLRSTNVSDGYQVIAVWDGTNSVMAVTVYSGSDYLAAVYNLSCGTLKSTISGTALTVSVGGTTVISLTNSTYTTGKPGVGTINCLGGQGIGTTVLAYVPPTPPSVPTGLAASNAYAWQINLSWSPSTGTPSAAGYYLYRATGGSYTKIGTITSCSSTCGYLDLAVLPNTSYQYKVSAYAASSAESSQSSAVSQTSATPSYHAPDPGGPLDFSTTWGAGIEKIGLLTGTLGMRLPLPKLQHRSSGPGFQMAASWNSFWTHDSAGDHMNAVDTGYGLGWNFQLGAAYPVYSSGSIDHYEFQDGGGIIHRLYLDSGTIYRSTDSTYLVFDHAARTMKFRDGTLWTFGCASIGIEPDSGALYPTVIRDSNGNQITIEYQGGQTSSGTFTSEINTSSRITKITDSVTTYIWLYNNYQNSYANLNGMPHVNLVYHRQSDGQQFNDAEFHYGTGVPGYPDTTSTAVSPFNSSNTSTQVLLTSITFTGSPGPFKIEYAPGGTISGEISKVTYPYTGYFRYVWNTMAYTSSGFSLSRREVANRYMSADGSTEQNYQFTHDNTDTAQPGTHTETTIIDPTSASNRKKWYFIHGSSYGWDNGLSNRMETWQASTSVLRTVDTTWTQYTSPTGTSAPMANPRACATTTILEDGTTQSTTESDVDVNGNVTAVREYAMAQHSGNTAPASTACSAGAANVSSGALYRTSATTYQTGTGYTNANILNRPTQIDLWAGAVTTGTLMSRKSITYDGTGCCYDVSGITQHDSAYAAGMTPVRGNPTTVVSGASSTTMTTNSYYDIAGNVTSTNDGLGHTVQSTSYLSSGQVQSVTAGGNTSTVGYNDDMTTNTVTGSNSDTSTFGYTSAGYRTRTTTNPDGTVVTHGYSDMNTSGILGQTWSYPYYSETTTPAGVKSRTWVDGFGRTTRTAVRESTGSFDVWISTRTDYDACSCSATGKAVTTSRPYRSNIGGDPINSSGTVISTSTLKWTTTSSDGLGRTVSVTLPDSSSSSYSYGVTSASLTKMDGTTSETVYGTTTTITDPMSKQKRYFYDGLGNLRRVDEPNSSSTLTETARYAYDELGRMRKVMMGPQTRTFTYNLLGQLTSSQTPEKGTVNYTYYADGTLHSKTDPLSQTLWYAYDGSRRLLTIKLGSTESTATTLTTFTYDSATNGVGKMATAQNCYAGAGGSKCYTWSYAYNISGRVTTQQLQTPYNDPASSGGTSPLLVKMGYTYDNDGKPTTVNYPGSLSYSPGAGLPYQNVYDSAGRPTGVNCWDSTNSQWRARADTVTYNASSQMTGWHEMTSNPCDVAVNTYSLTRAYDDSRGWMTNVSRPSDGALNIDYTHNANGQVTQIVDNANSAQGITSYTYDSLNRLKTANAGTTGTTSWTMTYDYDAFGNRLSETGTGTASGIHQTLDYDGTNHTNRIISTNYAYDSNGNLTGMPTSGTHTATMAYDAFDRLGTYTDNYTGDSTTMRYDAFGRRVAKTLPSNGVRIYFNDMSGRLVAEYDLTLDSSGVPTTYGLAGPSRSTMFFAGQRLYQHTDRIGSTRVQGGVNSHYYPYGQEVASTANDTYKFAQTYRDSDSGLDYAGARYYAGPIGRFANPDSVVASSATQSPQGWNAYAYAEGDPVNGTDPSGSVVCWANDPNCNPDNVVFFKSSIDICTSSAYWNGMLSMVQMLMCSVANSGAGIARPPNNQAPAQIASKIGFVQNCSYAKGSLNGNYVLNIEYQVLDQNGQPMDVSPSIQVTESITTKTGPTIVAGAPWSVPGTMSSDGTFWDTLYEPPTDASNVSTINQSFYINGVLAPVVNIPGIPNTVNTTVLPGRLSLPKVTVDGVSASQDCSKVKGAPAR